MAFLKRLRFIVIFLIVVLSACSIKSEEKTFRTSFGLEFTHPSDWEVKELSAENAEISPKFISLKRPQYTTWDGFERFTHPYDGLLISYAPARPEDNLRDCDYVKQEYSVNGVIFKDCKTITLNNRLYLQETNEEQGGVNIIFSTSVGSYILKARAIIGADDFINQSELYESIISTFTFNKEPVSTLTQKVSNPLKNEKGVLFANANSVNFYNFKTKLTEEILPLGSSTKPITYLNNRLFVEDTTNLPRLHIGYLYLLEEDLKDWFWDFSMVRKINLQNGSWEFVYIPKFDSAMIFGEYFLTDKGGLVYGTTPIEINKRELRIYNLKDQKEKYFLDDIPSQMQCETNTDNSIFEGYNSLTNSFEILVDRLEEPEGSLCGWGEVDRFSLGLDGVVNVATFANTEIDKIIKKKKYSCDGHEVLFDPFNKTVSMRKNGKKISVSGEFLGCVN